MNKSVNCWDIINKLSRDKSLWDYLEPAEIIEIVQRINEAKEKIKGFEKYIHVDLTPALLKLPSLMGHLHLNSVHSLDQSPINFNSFEQKLVAEC